MRYSFADCLLDTAKYRLTRAGKTVEVEPQVFALIELVVSRAGDLVTRDELVEVVWKGRIVSEATIAARISAARAALGDTGRAQAVLRTVVSRGVQLAVPVAVEGAEPAAAPAEPGERPAVRFATAPDGSGLAWTAHGDGPPLLRGGHWLTHLELDWDNPVWRALLTRLGQGRRLIRYDLRGTGVSQRDAGAVTLDTLVEDMLVVADAAGAERFDIFAASQNAPVSVAFAARYPERVRRLVILGGFLTGAELRGEGEQGLSEAFVALVRGGWGSHGSAFMRSFAAFFMPDATEAQVSAFTEMQLASVSADGAVALRRAIGQLDARPFAAQVRAPTLVIHARNDALQPFAEGQALAQAIPGAEFLALESANHVPLPQDPAWSAMMAATEAFLGR